MRRLAPLVLLALACACTQLANLKASMFAPDHPWARITQPSGPAVDRFAAKCTIPIHDASFYGFSVGHPQNWRIDFSTGTLFTSRDERAHVGAIIYPARVVHADVTPEAIAAAFADGFGKLITSAGGTFQLVDKVTDGRIASALMVATIDGLPVRGPLQVIMTPGFATLKLYWAPEHQLEQEEPALVQIVSCFQRHQNVTTKHLQLPVGDAPQTIGMPPRQRKAAVEPLPLVANHGNFISVQMPAGWKTQDESQYGIDLVSADAQLAFGFGWFLNPHEHADVYVIQGLQQYFPGARMLTAGFTASPPGWQVAEAEFEGIVRGAEVHGISRVAVGKGVALTSLWTAPPKRWEEARPTLEAVAATAFLLPAAVAQVSAEARQQLTSYPQVRPSRAPTTAIGGGPDLGAWELAAHDGWVGGIFGQERVLLPSTHEIWTVRMNAWSADGPSGPGYYHGSERLEATTPTAPTPPTN